MTEYWNHNVAYHPLVLGAVQAGCRDVLDVGCGDGMLARKLAAPGRQVTGVDRAPEMVERARAASAGISGLEFLEGDFLDWPCRKAIFDFVCFVASVHHMDFGRALTKASALLRPGGRLVVVGLASNATRADWVVSGLCLPATRVFNLRPDYGDPGAPVADSTLSWGQVREQARELLPGVRYRHHLHYRYSLRWTKPDLPDRPAFSGISAGKTWSDLTQE